MITRTSSRRRRFFHQYRPIAITEEEFARINTGFSLVRWTKRTLVATLICSLLAYGICRTPLVANETIWPILDFLM